MPVSSLRILKESRLVFWTWLVVILTAMLKAAATALGSSNTFDVAGAVGFWVGIPLLVNVAFGEEFHQRTITLLLSQPIDRMKLWSEKWLVLTVAISSSTLIYWLTWPNAHPDGYVLLAGIWVLVTVCTGTYWTLKSRSTIGGLALNIIQMAIVFTIANLLQWRLGMNSVEALLIVGIFAMIYGAIMFSLGRRKFVGLEITGDVATEDLLSRRRDLATGALRSKRSEPTLNLVRKELRFIWPVWTITAITILFLLAVSLVRYSGASLLIFSIPLVFSLIPAVLAGSLSMGEERTAGTHLWHLTLPISNSRQWLIKLAVALIVNAICFSAVTITALALQEGSLSAVLTNLFTRNFWFLLLLSSLLTFIAFWCSCVMKGTVGAFISVLPVCVALGIAVVIAKFTAQDLHDSSLLASLLSIVHPYPWDNRTWGTIDRLLYQPYQDVLVMAAPVVFVGLLQTKRLFQSETSNSPWQLTRRLLPPVAILFLVAFIQAIPLALLVNSSNETRQVLKETADAVAIETSHMDISTLSPASAHTFTLADLRQTSAMSPITHRWLSDATISVMNKQTPHPVFRNRHMETDVFPYVAVVHLKNDWNCSVFPGYDPGYFFCTSPNAAWGVQRLPR